MTTLAVDPAGRYADKVSLFGVYMQYTVGFAFDDFLQRALEYPGPGCLTIEMLEHFAAGDAEADIPPLSKELEIDLLALVRWWSSIQEEIAGLWHVDTEQERPPVPGLDEAESAMKRVRLALAAVITDTSEDDNPLPAFLCSHRLWTRSICEMGRKGWPGIDWTYLNQVV